MVSLSGRETAGESARIGRRGPDADLEDWCEDGAKNERSIFSGELREIANEGGGHLSSIRATMLVRAPAPAPLFPSRCPSSTPLPFPHRKTLEENMSEHSSS